MRYSQYSTANMTSRRMLYPQPPPTLHSTNIHLLPSPTPTPSFHPYVAWRNISEFVMNINRLLSRYLE